MKKTNLSKLYASLYLLCSYNIIYTKIFETLNKDNVKTQYNIAKIVMSNGAAGASDLIVQGAVAAKNAIASSIEQGQIAIEKAKAEYAQSEMQKAKDEVELLKKEILSLKKELEALKSSLKKK